MTTLGLLATAIVAIVATGCGALLHVRAPWEIGLVAMTVLLPAQMFRTWCEYQTSAWNKGVGLLARFLRAYVHKVVYFSFMCPLRLGGSALDLGRADAKPSRWISTKVPDNDLLVSSERAAVWNGMHVGADERQTWTIWLLPIMWLLVVLRDKQQENVPPSSTYTLY
jgi:hypothetical protein